MDRDLFIGSVSLYFIGALMVSKAEWSDVGFVLIATAIVCWFSDREETQPHTRLIQRLTIVVWLASPWIGLFRSILIGCDTPVGISVTSRDQGQV